MRWIVVIGFLVCLARLGSSGALKCLPSSKDQQCLDRQRTETSNENKNTSSLEAECLAGTEWDSNCHSCRCSDAGVASCTKVEVCDKEKLDLEPIRCKPNSTFKRDCNTCVCLDSGLGLCTLKLCKQASTLNQLSLVYGKDCAPGTSWKSQCNDCKCSEDGLLACTEKACPGQESEVALRCAPHSAWKNECNTCWCTAEGRAMCTRMGCIGASDLHFEDEEVIEINDGAKQENIDLIFGDGHNVVKRSTCKANQSFQSECNTCKCSADGQSYRCTQNECMDKEERVDKEVEVFMESEGIDHIERHSVCRPRATFYIGCNTCHCNFDGTDYSCTNKPCPLPEDVELFHELKAKSKSALNKTIVCVANRMFIRDCNTCWCNEDGTGFFCTRKVCVQELPDDVSADEEKPEELRILKRECRPDEVFEADCNMCRCNPDGQSFSCTKRACLTEPPTEGLDYDVKNASLSRKIRAIPTQEPAKQCLPGQEFRLDCNTCLCDNKGKDFSCTRNDCRAVSTNGNGGTRKKREVAQQEITQCEPGSVFDQGCSVCRCTSDGRHATCTLKRCSLKPEIDSQDEDTDASDPNFRCDPGEQFKRGCNDCTCSADGKSIFCTLRICDKDLMPKL